MPADAKIHLITDVKTGVHRICTQTKQKRDQSCAPSTHGQGREFLTTSPSREQTLTCVAAAARQKATAAHLMVGDKSAALRIGTPKPALINAFQYGAPKTTQHVSNDDIFTQLTHVPDVGPQALQSRTHSLSTCTPTLGNSEESAPNETQKHTQPPWADYIS